MKQIDGQLSFHFDSAEYHLSLSEADAELVKVCKDYLAENGSLHLGTIIRRFHVPPVMALSVTEKLLSAGLIEADGKAKRAGSRATWTHKER